jgi:cold shock protein
MLSQPEVEVAVPTGRVKWYDAAKGYGFVTSDEGGDVFLPRSALPNGVTELKSGQKIEFGLIEGRKGSQALGVSLVEAPPSVATLRRRPPEELHGVIEDMIKVLEAKVLPDLRRGRYPDKRTAQKVAQVVHAVARELDG